MKAKEFKSKIAGKDATALISELEALRKEQFNLRMQKATGQLTQTNQLREVKTNIARVKTSIRQAGK